MSYRVTLIPGDGIGPEVSEAARRVFDATGVGFEWEVREAGMTRWRATAMCCRRRRWIRSERNKVGLKGPITTPIGSGFRSVNVGLRQALGLYANLRPGKTHQGRAERLRRHRPGRRPREPGRDVRRGRVRHRHARGGRGHRRDQRAQQEADRRPSAAISIKMITPEDSRRIVEFAFEYARANGRKKVTAVHKANIMKFTDGLFLRDRAGRRRRATPTSSSTTGSSTTCACS